MAKSDPPHTAAPAERKARTILAGTGCVSVVQPPPGGWPLPDNLAANLQIFRDNVGRGWREPAPDAVRGHLASIADVMRIAREGVDASFATRVGKDTLRAIRTLLCTLPDRPPSDKAEARSGFITIAEAAAQRAAKEGLPSHGAWLAWRGRELLAALEPWKPLFDREELRPDMRGRWHWFAIALAFEVQAIIRAGTNARKAASSKPTDPTVKVLEKLLVEAGLHPAALDGIVKVLQKRKRKK